MCGIIGFIKEPKASVLMSTLEKVVTQALYVDSVRGWDSTGLAIISNNKTLPVEMYKRALPAADFITTKKGFSMLDSFSLVEGVIGHNRAATRGVVTDDNAHPFQEGSITMVHNGTLDNHRSLVKHTPKDTVVDSHFLCHALAESKDIIKTLEDVRGAYAIVWYDSNTNKYYVARNDGRPLGYVLNKDNNVLFFASESRMIHWIADRNNVDVTDTLYEFKEGILYEIDPEDISNIKETEFKASSSQTWVGNTWNNWNKNYGNKYNKPSNTGGGGKERNNILVKALKKLGLDKDTVVAFTPILFDRFSGNPLMGSVEGWVEYIINGKKETDNAVMYGIERAKALEWISNSDLNSKRIGSTVVSVREVKGEDVVLVLNNSGVIEDVKIPKIIRAKPPIILGNSNKQLPKPRVKIKRKSKKSLGNFAVGPDGVILSTEEFRQLTSTGCSCCGEWVDPTYSEEVLWSGKYGDEPICMYCADSKEVLQSIGASTQ